MKSVSQQDIINRKAWSSWGAKRWFRTIEDWTDPGEAAAIGLIADKVRGTPVLDVGVGGGRTVPLLSKLSDTYEAIDYMQEMVEICGRRHPGVRVRRMDARDLSAFDDNDFGLVMFSFNGIDAVDYAGRRAILREFARVLRPGGSLVFSTHNMHGPSYRENLTQFLKWPDFSPNPLRFGFNIARRVINLPLATVNYMRNSRMNREFDGYAIHVCAAHKFGIVIVYMDMQTQIRELEKLGFTIDAVFGNLSKEPLHPGDNVDRVNWFHFVAHKNFAPMWLSHDA